MSPGGGGGEGVTVQTCGNRISIVGHLLSPENVKHYIIMSIFVLFLLIVFFSNNLTLTFALETQNF